MAQLKTLQATANKEQGYYQDNHRRATMQGSTSDKAYIDTMKDGIDHWQGIIDVLNGKEESEAE
jgi:hypothetical protein